MYSLPGEEVENVAEERKLSLLKFFGGIEFFHSRDLSCQRVARPSLYSSDSISIRQMLSTVYDTFTGLKLPKSHQT